MTSSSTAFNQAVQRNLRRNYLVQLAHGLFGQTGFRLIQAPTFIPAYVYTLSGSELMVGVARACQALGQALTPVLGATLVEHRRRVLSLALVVGALMRLQVLGIALAGILLSATWNLVALCLLLGLFGFFLGIQGVVFNFLRAKTIPPEQRGLLAGLRNALAGVCASAVAYLGGRYLIEPEVLGNGYAAVFGVAFLLTALGLSMLALVREPDSPEVRERSGVMARLRDLPALMRSDRNFTMYFLARALGSMGRMALPYYVLFAGTRVELTGGTLGILTAAFLIGQTGINLIWGILADRRGFRIVFNASLLVWILAVLLLMQTTDLLPLSFAFVALGTGVGGFMLAAQNLVLEFGSLKNLPMRIAVANSVSELTTIVGPLLGGVLVMSVSYLPVFWIAIVFKCAAIVIMTRYVSEPRHR
ncbi:MAG: MFS transporter [Deltaproteobacteria bacterium]|nr:MAG: MFS transporter [Deltaproteobacteria bacterium]TDJ05200.1 MAG: MFS transporter [Deltaproteobacteria bacterium]